MCTCNIFMYKFLFVKKIVLVKYYIFIYSYNLYVIFYQYIINRTINYLNKFSRLNFYSIELINF